MGLLKGFINGGINGNFQIEAVPLLDGLADPDGSLDSYISVSLNPNSFLVLRLIAAATQVNVGPAAHRR